MHPYPRLAPDRQMAKWLTWMRDRARLNAWTISREGVDTTFGTCKQVYVVTRACLIGILQHNDERDTQTEFDNLVDTVLQTFYANIHLNMPETVDIQGPAQLRTEELHLVTDTAVHYAEITIMIQQTAHM